MPFLAVAAGCGGSHAAEPPPATPGPASLAAPVPHLDPYKAAVAYARCMRAHGVPHPDPDANGDFHLTPAQDKAMHSVSRKQHEAADAACFHLLKGTVSTQPLSRGAQRAALVPLGEVRQCMLGFGYRLRQADREEHEPGTRDVRLRSPHRNRRARRHARRSWAQSTPARSA